MGAIVCVISILTPFNTKQYLAYLYQCKHSVFAKRWDNWYAIVCPNLTYLWRHSRTALLRQRWHFTVVFGVEFLSNKTRLWCRVVHPGLIITVITLLSGFLSLLCYSTRHVSVWRTKWVDRRRLAAVVQVLGSCKDAVTSQTWYIQVIATTTHFDCMTSFDTQKQRHIIQLQYDRRSYWLLL